MKITPLLIGVCLLPIFTGCTTAPLVSSPVVSSPAADNSSPGLVIPATGGAPLLAIPVGGNQYLPVTGGPPITGIPTGP